MKKFVYLLIILMAIAAHAGASSTTNQSPVDIAQRLFDEATGDKSPTLDEMDLVLEQLNKLSKQDRNMSTEKKSSLLRVKVLRYKYSLIEAPSFKNNKGGLAFLLDAKTIANDWIRKNPNDVDFLVQLQMIEVELKERPRATIEKMLKADPNNGWFHYISSLDYYSHNEPAKAIEELILAIKIEKNIRLELVYMEKGIELADDAKCNFKNNLQKLFEKIPQRLRSEEGQINTNGPEYEKLAIEFQKIKSEYIHVFKVENCSKISK